jgi:hypothetical protein
MDGAAARPHRGDPPRAGRRMTERPPRPVELGASRALLAFDGQARQRTRIIGQLVQPDGDRVTPCANVCGRAAVG